MMELIHEHLSTFEGSFTGQYAQHVRRYSIAGCPPVITRCTMAEEAWTVVVQAMKPDGSTEPLLIEQIPPRADNGERDADRLASIAARMLIEASRAVDNEAGAAPNHEEPT